jgi:hypothetical protein
MALRGVMQQEELPAPFSDPVYLRTKERKVFTSFSDSERLAALGNCCAGPQAL